jgi:hypothetical protein
MNLDAWLACALEDAERRGLPDLRPLLESLAASTRALRAADWNADARGGRDTREPTAPGQSDDR